MQAILSAVPSQSVSSDLHLPGAFPRGYFRERYLHAARAEGWGRKGFENGCGGATICFRSKSGEVRLAPRLCDRWSCAVCSTRRAAWLTRQVREARDKHGLLSFWTLTLRDKKLAEDGAVTFLEAVVSFRRVTAAWNRLRTRLTRLHGKFTYVWTVEATRRGFAHLHLLTSLAVDQGELSELWCEASDGSWVVDVQPVDSARACAYITKYCAKQATAGRPAHTRAFSRSRDCEFDPFRPVVRPGWVGQVVNIAYWEMVKAVADQGGELVRCTFAGVPSAALGQAEGPLFWIGGGSNLESGDLE
jgi:hypothetical protein